MTMHSCFCQETFLDDRFHLWLSGQQTGVAREQVTSRHVHRACCFVVGEKEAFLSVKVVFVTLRT